MTRARISLVVAMLLLGPACGAGDGAGGGVDEGAWSYPEHQFVVDGVELPLSATEANAVGFDLDTDGTIDNRLGEMLTALQGAMGSSSPQDSINLALREGLMISLLSIYAVDLTTSPKANAWTFVGQPQALTDGPQPGGTFTLDPAAPIDAYFGGRIKNGVGYFGGPDAAFMLRTPFTDYGTLDLPLKSVRMEFDVSADGLALENGRLAGAVTEADLQTEVLPQLTDLLDAVLERNCTDRGGTGGAGVCGCVPSSGTATIQSLFDANGDCYVTLDEVTGNNLLATLLAGDVTLPDGSRAISLAVGFHAVNAVYPHPAPPQ
ncbi:MAG: hypothetical protein HY906_06130 [Deltaproteobacteria bacterium]|nr:hypothetical protein [Deltaproteobacteria bacterium]